MHCTYQPPREPRTVRTSLLRAVRTVLGPRAVCLSYVQHAGGRYVQPVRTVRRPRDVRVSTGTKTQHRFDRATYEELARVHDLDALRRQGDPPSGRHSRCLVLGASWLWCCQYVPGEEVADEPQHIQARAELKGLRTRGQGNARRGQRAWREALGRHWMWACGHVLCMCMRMCMCMCSEERATCVAGGTGQH